MQTEKQGFFKDTQQLAEDYIRERLYLLKLEVAERSAKLASVMVTAMIVWAFLSIVLLLISAALCYYLQTITGSWLYGIGIVILFYIAIIILVFIFRKSFFYRHISNFIIRIFFEKSDNNEAGK